MKGIKEQAKKEVSVITVDEQHLRAHVSEVVHQSVEETLNGLLQAEADALCQAPDVTSGHSPSTPRHSPIKPISKGKGALPRIPVSLFSQ